MVKRFFLSLVLLGSTLFGLSVVNPTIAYAQDNPNCTKSAGGFLQFPTWYKYLDFEERSDECEIGFEITTDIPLVFLAIFEIILRIAGMVAVVFVIYGGFTYLLSQGEPEKTKNAKGTILNAFIGLVITISATAIVNLIARNIQ